MKDTTSIVQSSEARVVALIEDAHVALAEARSLGDLKTVAKGAESLRYLTKQAGLSRKIQNDAAEIRLRAQRQMGELLAKRDQNQGGRPGKTSDIVSPVSEPPTLANIGISRKQSSRLQRTAKIPEEVFEAHIAKVKAQPNGELTSTGLLKLAKKQLREQVRQEDQKRILNLLPVEGKFRTILIDPPWDYGGLSLAGRAAPTYAVMSLEELRALSVADWADEQCHLYLWTTNNFFREALKLSAHWGFAYKTVITWVKPSFGLGSYFRNSTEHCLFSIKGKLTTRVKDIATHFASPRLAHSVKPEQLYVIAERASYAPRLEVFARQTREGWERAFK